MRRAVLFALAGVACAPGAPTVPKAEGPRVDWSGADRLLDSAIAARAAPGAVLGVSWRGVRHVRAAGALGSGAGQRPDARTIYDLASLTKVVGLTTAVMLAVQEGLLELDAPVQH